MTIGVRVTDLPAASAALDDDDEFLVLEDSALKRGSKAQTGPKAANVSVADTANQFTATDVEGVLAEVQDNVDALVISGGGMSVASEAEALAGTNNTKAMTPAKVAVIAEKYDARRSGVDTAASAAVNAAALQSAIDTVKVTAGGKLRIPKGTYEFDTTLEIDDDYFEFAGDERRGTVLKYTGAGQAVVVTGTSNVSIKRLCIENTGTGTDGIVLGDLAGGIRLFYEVDNVDIRGFSGYGLHVANCEQLHAKRVYASNNGNGFRVDNSLGATFGMANKFDLCRAESSTAEGWWFDKQLAMSVNNCESLNSGGAYQARVAGSGVFACHFVNFDLEDVTNAGTKVGIRLVGFSHSTFTGGLFYGNGTDIQVGSSVGFQLGPSRYEATKPVDDIGSNTAFTIYDGGNLSGSTYLSLTGEISFLGNLTRSEQFIVAGGAGAGYIEFAQEQSPDPSAPSANRARLFIKDNGAGKTQLAVRFPSGATQVFATEP